MNLSGVRLQTVPLSTDDFRANHLLRAASGSTSGLIHTDGAASKDPCGPNPAEKLARIRTSILRLGSVTLRYWLVPNFKRKHEEGFDQPSSTDPFVETVFCCYTSSVFDSEPFT